MAVDKTSLEWLNMECPICKKRFHLKQCAIKRAKTHYCSRECSRIAKIDAMSGENNHQYGLKGRKNASWKSDRRLTRYGYIIVRVLDHPFRDQDDFMFEHRLVAEKYLLTPENSVEVNGKRFLSKEYAVHHINFNKTDNRPENLKVMKRSEHTAFHSRLNLRPKSEKGMFEENKYVATPIRTQESAEIPEPEQIGEVGYTLLSDIPVAETISPGETKEINTHIAFNIKKGYCGVVYARHSRISGRKFSTKPISVVWRSGCGEISIPICNNTDHDIQIVPREQIAKVIFTQPADLQLENC